MHYFLFGKISAGASLPPSAKPFLLAMKIFLIMFAVFTLGAHAEGMAQRVTLSMKNAELEQVFTEIRRQTDYRFLYRDEVVSSARPVTIDVKDESLDVVLTMLSESQRLRYRIIGGTVTITKLVDLPDGAAGVPQQVRITGVVKDKQGAPLAGAAVKVKGTSIETSTDDNGTFVLTGLAADAVLVVSHLGHASQELAVKGRASLAVTLDAVDAELDEVVVVAYGTTSTRNVTGSVSRVKGDELASAPLLSFEGGLSGRAAGVNMVANTGVVNQAPVFRIRGINSLSLSSYPLVVIDGIPAYTEEVNAGGNASVNPLASINPADIESIDIAKDAAATSLYGSRAANGVVFVTTKKGKQGSAKLNYNGSYGWNKGGRFADILNAEQYLEIKNEGLRNAGTYDPVSNYYDYSIGPDGDTVRTNWFDHIFRTGRTQNHSLNVSGANQTTNYYASVGYMDQQGIIIGNDYQRQSVSFNVNHKFLSWLQVGNRTNYAHDKTTALLSNGYGASNNSANSVAYRMALISAPIIGPYNRDGSYNVTGLNLGLMDNLGHLTSTARMGYTNPEISLNTNNDETGNNYIQSNTFIQVTPLRWLTLKTAYAIDNMYSRTERYFSPISMEGYNDRGSATGVSSRREKWIWTNTANATFSLADYDFDVLIGQEQQKTTGDQFGVKRFNQTDGHYSDLQGGYSNVQVLNTDNQRSYQYLNSLFSRVQLNYAGKYLLSANVRQDESSLLGLNNKTGVFWGLSGGWVISEESFYTGSPLSRAMDFVKLKASYGKVGNLSGIGDFQSLSTYAAILNGTASGLYFNAAGNPDLKWETSKKLDVGISMGFLNSRITADIDYYNNNIDGLIFGVPVPSSAGLPGAEINTVLTNIGSMYNRGVELAVNGQLIRKEKLRWSAAFNVSYNKNEITALASSVDRLLLTMTGGGASISMVGSPVGRIYAIRTAGVDPATGRRIFLDGSDRKVLYTAVPAAGGYNYEYEDGTQAPTINTADDGVPYKPTNPKFFGGFSTSVSYGQFDVDLLFTFQTGGYMYNGTLGTLMDTRFANNSTLILDRWQQPGDITDVPRLMDGDIISWGYQMPVTSNVSSSDYLRFKNMNVGYTLDPAVSKRLKLERVRVYVAGQNLFLVTPYTGADPEVTSTGNASATQGYDRNMNPNTRIITAGVQLTF